MKIRNADHKEALELDMTPMIDIVFQLLVFFIMSFNIVQPEGDFSIRMPSPSSSRSATPSEIPPLKVRVLSANNGTFAGLSFGARHIKGTSTDAFNELTELIKEEVHNSAGPGAENDLEIELAFDYDLKYQYVIQTIASVTGYYDSNRKLHKLIEKIKFTPPDKQTE